MTYKQAKIILEYARSNMEFRAAAERLYISDGSIRYQFRRIKAETGRDPTNFYDLCYLVGIAAQVRAGNEHVTFR